ncbi:MAG: hypothetical protein MJ110_06830 [Lachnospiraceae bacterium]|nr:hypothetical protein [Lachnospiraceae bacterium]
MKRYLSVLQDSLRQKNELLTELGQLCDEQESILRDETLDADTFDGLVNQKDVLIDRIVKLDNGFEAVYDKIRDKVEIEKKLYTKEISQIQELLTKTIELTTVLQAKEKRLKNMLDRKIAGMKKEIGQARRGSRAAYDYYKSMSGYGGTIPSQFTEKS